MKKIVLGFLLVFLMWFLYACTKEELSPVDLSELEDDILMQIPDQINSDFKLDIDDSYQVTYELLNQKSEGFFDYVSPFYDQRGTMKITVQKGDSKLDIEKEVTLVSLESGLNETKISINLNVPLSQVNKEDYVLASVKVETKKNDEIVIEHETSEAKLRGRGNSTWFVYEKKPYRLRFDKNTSILGMPAAKNYVLLAEYADKSLIRNAITHKMSSLFTNLDYTIEVRFVELTINNEYLGLYLLTEQVENHPNKLNLDSTPGVLDTDYLFELDMRFFEQNVEPGYDWFLDDRHAYQIKDPDPDELAYTKNHAAYLESYLAELEDALAAKSGYEAYIDVDNAVDYFLVHEILKSVDVGWSSVFMIKHKGGHLSFGPLWDFDFAYGNTNYNNYGDGPEGWYGMRDGKNRIFELMMQIPAIRTKFAVRFEMYYNEILPLMAELIPVLSSSITEMANRNFKRWPILKSYVWPNPQAILELDTHKKQVDFVINFLLYRSNWINEHIDGSSYHYGYFD